MMAAAAPSDPANAVPVRWRPAAAGGAGGGVPATPGSCRLVADCGSGDDAAVVVGIQGQAEREPARAAIREAIAAELVLLSGLAPECIALHTPTGQVPWAELAFPDGPRRAWLAISHDGELSVAAISLRGPVGIDVSLVADIPDWEPVARDYLGPDATAALAALAPDARPAAFARAWSEREARLKYLGRELVEWSLEGDRALSACRCLPLALPGGYAGVLTLPP